MSTPRGWKYWNSGGVIVTVNKRRTNMQKVDAGHDEHSETIELL